MLVGNNLSKDVFDYFSHVKIMFIACYVQVPLNNTGVNKRLADGICTQHAINKIHHGKWR